ncbi:MAG: hypothetical protein A3F94_00155 [Candidatus Spechtbacteria bacterium RIFCSPLOWO2_12_FULL_38_22]|uniref:Core domain-containing protein n=1 Tax=Candidatus Spechtbacteria bacterium RIFCSPLOWO2_12_FULL_38_22 TaxID=1802165 RepID=A0A1G2HGQ6_9BACT|nr:MAG: hypothetical protein A2728_03330 [Candidatus Spechtbacteria bacterium RIFCSPHIGHO2_01_FULL_38_11]OGZ59214.1 MAG: hypothetical protein A3E58_00155 [Candidatus Spechtbacteria bacterium RIFCSPHIGHO2_12_FULL_38_30]OGZ59993.1 MAG: hypothetical protein A3A00_01335 [Candidatus Spechtbacteria bacterium RIFCSPLOWO2_01_FULL_38_20]OGZ61633.1 MAG: hypothetical protein A3F94_00155 [Candidatus Spechtbacteria bacterium RIFCSPLOWO2_12_FULL_38_22]
MSQPIDIRPRGITLTELAQEELKNLIDIEKQKRGCSQLYLRLGVQSGGCSGFTYEMELDTVRSSDDWHKDFDGVEVVIDQESFRLLNGSEVDYIDNGLSGSGLKINNPNASRSCGCGNSFS